MQFMFSYVQCLYVGVTNTTQQELHLKLWVSAAFSARKQDRLVLSCRSPDAVALRCPEDQQPSALSGRQRIGRFGDLAEPG